jgi:hypothetical protein
MVKSTYINNLVMQPATGQGNATIDARNIYGTVTWNEVQGSLRAIYVAGAIVGNVSNKLTTFNIAEAFSGADLTHIQYTGDTIIGTLVCTDSNVRLNIQTYDLIMNSGSVVFGDVL